MAFSSTEIQDHIRSVTERKPAVSNRRPSLDEYDRMEHKEPELDEQEQDGWE